MPLISGLFSVPEYFPIMIFNPGLKLISSNAPVSE
jgi:hypothetical protein